MYLGLHEVLLDPMSKLVRDVLIKIEEIHISINQSRSTVAENSMERIKKFSESKSSKASYTIKKKTNTSWSSSIIIGKRIQSLLDEIVELHFNVSPACEMFKINIMIPEYQILIILSLDMKISQYCVILIY